MLEYETLVFCGLDLGQSADFTDLAAVEVTRPKPPDRGVRVVEEGLGGRVVELVDRNPVSLEAEWQEWKRADKQKRYVVRGLREWDLGTDYTKIVADVTRMFAKPPLRGSTLVVDKTGVGAAVVNMFCRARDVGEWCTRCEGDGFTQGQVERQDCLECGGPGKIKLKASIRPITITAGQGAADDGPGWRVSKKELVSCLVALLDGGRMTYPKTHALTPKLLKQLENFKLKITKAGNETFEAWKEADHDDLVMALGMACWASERGSRQLWVK